MCGISGIFSLNQQAVSGHKLQLMTDALIHRGPDGEGMWIDDSGLVGFGHRRLSIIDLTDNACQPMTYRERYTITYNGEIYNYLEIKDELQKKGHLFFSGSDTEVILAAYAEYGENCLNLFDGMFAFAIWDKLEKSLFCARDRFGEKPFYFHHLHGESFSFASEIKGLFAAGITKKVNERMLFYYLNYDVVEIAFDKKTTFYDGIYALEAGHYLKFNTNGKLTKKRYWTLNPGIVDNNISFEQACERFRELFIQSVSRRLRADVNIGSSLSGGIDSSSIVLVINKLIENHFLQNTFSARFKQPEIDEGKYINLVTESKRINSFQVYPSAETLIKDFDKLFYHQEQPFGSASIFAQWEVMKLASKNNVTVLLDGQGADETLAGYPRFFNSYFKQLYLTDRKEMEVEIEGYETNYNTSFNKNGSFLSEVYTPGLLIQLAHLKRKYTNSSNYMKLNPDFYNNYKTGHSPFNYFNSLNGELHYSTVDYGLSKLLHFSDRNSMAFSREVRLPFLSHKLVEFVFSLPAQYKLHNGWTKHLLRESMKGILPEELRTRVNKIGFEAPQKQWLQSPEFQDEVNTAKNFLVNERILLPDARVSDWQCLMAHKLFTLTNSIML